MKKYSWKERIRYWFDNIMSRGMMAEIILLFIITVVFLFLMGVVTACVTGNSMNLLPWGMWMTLLHTLDPGTISGTEGSVLFIALMLIATVYGLLFTAILIGLINDGISTKMQSLAKGRGKVLERGHTLILGFNDATITLLRELILANENQRSRQPVVVMDDVDAAEMEEQIRNQLVEAGKPGRTAIICRRGTIYDIAALERCGIEDSNSVIINAETDFDTIKTILASTYTLNHAKKESDSYVVAVIYSDDNEDVAKIAGNDGYEDDRLEMLLLQKTLARIMVHTSRQPGLSMVFTELFNFSGMEFYLVNRDPAFEKLIGMTIQEINHYLRTSIAIGVYRQGEGTVIDAPGNVHFEEGDSLLVLEEDDDPLVVEEMEHRGNTANVEVITPEKALNILILGVYPIINNVLLEYSNYLPSGTNLYVADIRENSAGDIKERTTAAVEKTGCHIIIEEGINTLEIEKMNALLDRTQPDSVLLLLDPDNDPEEEDEKIMKQLLYLRQYRKRTDRFFNIASEINLARDEKLANATGSDDFIISRQISALLMAQISQKREMRSVFTTLLSQEGFEIYMKKAENYVPLNEPVDIYSIIDAAAQKHEIWIGMRKKTNERYESPVVNPAKHDQYGNLQMYTFTCDDYFVVLSKDITIS